MSDMSVHFSSATDDWATPLSFYQRLDMEFLFTLDPCSDKVNHKCDTYFTEEDDGLAQDWAPHVTFMNPPYGRVLKDWIRKAYEEGQKGATVVCLIPARPDTRYWHDYVMKADELRLIKGRLKFGAGTCAAPFPSCVVVFKETRRRKPKLTTMNAYI